MTRTTIVSARLTKPESLLQWQAPLCGTGAQAAASMARLRAFVTTVSRHFVPCRLLHHTEI
nr:uncharacterized protein CTRU02_02063 [Colletotrichum truncatum]KAF6799192.1 hypothetical protein CTRU02_02063 [Colletotrichum truncatum]